jgi:hypothetical protein
VIPRPSKLPPGAAPPNTKLVRLRAGIGLLLASGCIRAAGSVAEPTAIERQLLGAYQRLDRELVWVSSVRGDAAPAPENEALDEADARALRMRLLQRFNEDDLEQLQDWGCAAEGADARVLAVDCERVDDPTWTRIRARVLREENEARAVIIEWAAAVVARKAGRSSADAQGRAEMRAAYRELRRRAAEPDHLIEMDSGELAPASQWAPSRD